MTSRMHRRPFSEFVAILPAGFHARTIWEFELPASKGRWLLVVALLLLVAVALTFYDEQKSIAETVESSNHSGLVVQLAHQVLSELRDAETDQRGYLITGRLNYIKPFGGSEISALQHLARLDQLTLGNPKQQSRVRRLTDLTAQKLDELRHTLEIYDVRGLPPALETIKTDRGRVLMEQIGSAIGDIANEESLTRQRDQDLVQAKLARTRLSVGGAAVTLVALLALAAVWIRRELDAQKSLTRRLEQSQTELIETLNLLKAQARVLAASEAKLRLAFEAAQMSAWEWILNDQKHSAQTNGISVRSHFEGGIVNDLSDVLAEIHEDDRAEVQHTICTALREHSNFETVYRSGSSTVRWYSATGKYCPSDIGGPARVIGVTRDVTEYWRAQETAKQTEHQLHQSQKLEAVGRLASSVSHDFNNFLTVMHGCSDLLLMDASLSEDSRTLVVDISKTAIAATTLTRQLLSFGRKDAVEPTVLELNSVILGTEQIIRRLIGQEISLVLVLSNDSTNIRSDRGQIEQVIVNLVVNARDAMPHGGTLTVSTSIHSAGENSVWERSIGSEVQVVLSVSDTGTGMSADVQSKIFDPFFTTKQKDRGTGLGLSTVFGIVEQNDGKITVQSRMGVGSEFHVILPGVSTEATSLVKSQPDMELASETGTILVVDDDSTVRSFVIRVLREAGYTVYEAGDGEDGLETAREHAETIDLVLTDVVMPVMGGLDMAAELKRRHPSLAIVYMSGWADGELKENAVQTNQIQILGKPFLPDTLLRRVRGTLKKTILENAGRERTMTATAP